MKMDLEIDQKRKQVYYHKIHIHHHHPHNTTELQIITTRSFLREA